MSDEELKKETAKAMHDIIDNTRFAEIKTKSQLHKMVNCWEKKQCTTNRL